jgi:hypothetical protein
VNDDPLVELIRESAQQLLADLKFLDDLDEQTKYAETVIMLRTLSLTHEKEMLELATNLFSEVFSLIDHAGKKEYSYSRSRN